MNTMLEGPAVPAGADTAGANGMKHFREKHVLQHLKHYLPSQTPLKDFIHHNSLHAFQQQHFFDAIFTASKIFGYSVTLQLTEYRELYQTGRISKVILDHVIREEKGEAQLTVWKEKLLHGVFDTCSEARIGRLRANWKKVYQLDLDNLVQPLLFRVLCSYLDQGIALQKFPVQPGGFLASIRALEKNSFTSFFRTKRARQLLMSDDCTLTHLLKIVVGNEAFYEQYLFDQQFSHRGWSGMVAAVEAQPHTLLDRKPITLAELLQFELLLEIDALDVALGTGWEPLCNRIAQEPVDLFTPVPYTELGEVFTLWQKAFEWSYYDEVLAGMQQARTKNELGNTIGAEEKRVAANTTFKALFCIDERECSIRRHLEHVDPRCETAGTPGFFSVEFYFQPEGGQFYDKLCPAPVTPKYLVKESGSKEHRGHEMLYTTNTHRFFAGFISSLTLGFVALVRLVQNLARPVMSPAISNAFAHMHTDAQLTIENKDLSDRENDLQVGFTVPEMATRVEGLLRGIGMLQDFPSIVYVIAHGSSSANNPHHGAHDCGACSGRPGSVNARVFSFMANHVAVRELLQQRGIPIPPGTRFIGGLHDTAADQVQFYGEDELGVAHLAKHREYKATFEKALDLNAKERSRRFASINTKMDEKKVRKAILDRSVSLFEPRPELGHGTNTLCIIGSRQLTKGVFLDRRAFLNSYNYATDPEGTLLTGLMRPIGPVCGGINLEYYFSRVDNYKLGAGTKLPHNVMGLIGVANSSDGDLRPGLPLQMIEVHDPVRLLVIVEHYPDVVLKTVQSVPEMYEWYINEWVHLMAVHPETGQFYFFSNGAFKLYTPLAKSVMNVRSITAVLETAKEMDTNYIVDATKENLPVYTIN